jgi:aldose 1-epimerase
MTGNYSVRRETSGGVEVVRLLDEAHGVELAIAPSVGNSAFEWKVRGKSFLYFPYPDAAEFARQPHFCGVPFLAPWANRIDGNGFWANGKRYLFNHDLGNLWLDGNTLPIHGLLTYSDLWRVVEAKEDDRSAWLTSRLEFWRHPDLMAQFPFPHTLTMTYRLHDGTVEVQTAIDNHGTDPMPVAIGYHPYFRLHDVPREKWHVHLAARDHLTLNQQLIPTGESKPVEFANPHSLSAGQLDDVFANLVRDAGGLARFRVEGGRERITVSYGPKYTVAVVYAPKGKDFICFEPMAAITNAFNLAHAGLYKELQSVAPGTTWKESFWLAAG